MLQEYIQDEQERRVLLEWAQLLRARQEAAQAIELANVRTAPAALHTSNQRKSWTQNQTCQWCLTSVLPVPCLALPNSA